MDALLALAGIAESVCASDVSTESSDSDSAHSSNNTAERSKRKHEAGSDDSASDGEAEAKKFHRAEKGDGGRRAEKSGKESRTDKERRRRKREKSRRQHDRDQHRRDRSEKERRERKKSRREKKGSSSASTAPRPNKALKSPTSTTPTDQVHSPSASISEPTSAPLLSMAMTLSENASAGTTNGISLLRSPSAAAVTPSILPMIKQQSAPLLAQMSQIVKRENDVASISANGHAHSAFDSKTCVRHAQIARFIQGNTRSRPAYSQPQSPVATTQHQVSVTQSPHSRLAAELAVAMNQSAQHSTPVKAASQLPTHFVPNDGAVSAAANQSQSSPTQSSWINAQSYSAAMMAPQNGMTMSALYPQMSAMSMPAMLPSTMALSTPLMNNMQQQPINNMTGMQPTMTQYNTAIANQINQMHLQQQQQQHLHQQHLQHQHNQAQQAHAHAQAQAQAQAQAHAQAQAQAAAQAAVQAQAQAQAHQHHQQQQQQVAQHHRLHQVMQQQLQNMSVHHRMQAHPHQMHSAHPQHISAVTAPLVAVPNQPTLPLSIPILTV